MNNLMGNRIRECRRKAGLSQEELGIILGVKSAAIGKYEKGIVENIPRSSIAKMAELFNVKPSWLMGYDDYGSSHITCTAHEEAVLNAYRAHPEMQQAVDRLLGVEAAGTVEEDIAAEVSEAMKKSHVLK